MVERTRSISVLGTRAPAERPGLWVAAFGEADDHLRMTALLAKALGAGSNSPCLDPRSTWTARRDALREVIAQHRPDESGWVAGVVDPDLLFQRDLPPAVAWDDRSFAKERNELFRLLAQAAEQGGWQFLRTTSSAGAGIELEGLTEQAEPTPDTVQNPKYSDAVATLTPAVRPICRALVERGVLTTARAAATITSAASSAEAAIIAAAYDHLPRSAREAARRLSCLRPAQPVNGVLGPYVVVDTAAGSGQVLRGALEALRSVAFLQPSVGESALRMPFEVRLFLQQRASWPGGGSLDEHRWLARQLSAPAAPPEQLVEAHHHAIAAAEEDMAVETARYYGTDLRELAYSLSAARDFTAAARLYERIVTEFDEKDAYAWEYLAFNLARAKGAGATELQRRAIEDAYQRASELAPSNPLYRGRLLGYQARLGRDVRAAVERALHLWARDRTALSFFGKPVLEGLRAGRKQSLANELRKRWPAMDSYG